jgi:Tfp pilus assembly protein PilF
VRSASAAQVRRPIDRETARAAAYGDLLAPLRRLLRADETPPVPLPPVTRVPALAIAPDRRLASLPAAVRQQLAWAESALDIHREAAAAAIESARAACPGEVEPMRVQALLLSAQGRTDAALALLRSALERDPEYALLHNTLGVVQAAAASPAQARASFEQAFALDPRSAACENLARIHLDAGAPEEARRIYVDALERAPDLLPARLGLARLQREAGELVGAATNLRTCLAQDAGHVEAWAELADLCDGALSARDLQALFAALRRPGHSDRAQAELARACGRVLESRANPRQAWALIAFANGWLARNVEWDAARHARLCESVATAFARTATRAMDASLGHEIVFIVDAPRAGAELESDLAADADLARGGELPHLADLIEAESRARGLPFPQWAALATAADWQRLGEQYLARSEPLRRTRRRSTDRSPRLPLLLGAAAAMLPGARIIECRRDPLAACWALQREGREPHAAGLLDLASWWRDRARLLAAWRTRLGERMHAFDGELEGDARVEALEVAALHAGLPDADACIASHARRERERTAIDAREPGLRQSARAQDLGRLLAPLRALLAAGDDAAGPSTPAGAVE